jgi:uncharacterized protein (DUF983 family)
MGTGTGEVLAERHQAGQDVGASGRVFRVIICEACGWQYGAHWPRAEVYGYWGDCPHCGKVTTVGSSFLRARRAVSAAAAQQELGF